jgi:acetylornithine deacetylase
MHSGQAAAPSRRPGRDEELTQLLADLIAIDSVNPDLVPGGAGESAIADYCARWIEARGLEVHRLESRPGRPSIVGVARGTGGGRSLMLTGHYDTVTLAGYDGDPLEPRVADGRMHGRGAFDMKSGVAAAMVAAARAKRRRLSGDVIVACVADEEHASHGTEEVLMDFTADAAIVTEPSNLQAVIAHKGFVWFEITILGRAAHGSRPDLGIDAIAKAGHALVAIEKWGERLRLGRQHPALGPGTAHASIIQGGEEASSYPAECQIIIERRTLPGETGASVETELRDILGSVSRLVPDFRWKLRRGLERSPFEANREHPIVQQVLAQAEQVLGRPAGTRGEPFWTDCALLQDAGIPCLMFGADGAGAHGATEWVDLASVDALTEILTGAIRSFCA